MHFLGPREGFYYDLDVSSASEHMSKWRNAAQRWSREDDRVAQTWEC